MQIDRRVRANEVIQLLSVGKTKFYKMIKNGEFPEPVKKSKTDVFWYESTVKKEVEKYKENSDTLACA